MHAHGFMVRTWPHAFGVDVAGTVEAVGEATARTFTVPDALSLDEATSLPVGYNTACMMLFHARMGMHLGAPLLVYGASSSIGLNAVQLAKNAGRVVVAVASSRNADMLQPRARACCARAAATSRGRPSSRRPTQAPRASSMACASPAPTWAARITTPTTRPPLVASHIALLGGLVEPRALKPSTVEILGGQSAVPGGFARMQAGQVSGV
ncbi:hypothetical protein KFE25_004216 [Diacronema lutheri]|uniref:Alcohol dehydrogenase-like C-terminal domain-containing protein n=1 Tax=Diacronema lutheri TaxID=2081491 RepID=A0A8J5XDV8_DIALT|nr:hypothetical protein KFE25_004216 [Diacronema lutheri]